MVRWLRDKLHETEFLLCFTRIDGKRLLECSDQDLIVKIILIWNTFIFVLLTLSFLLGNRRIEVGNTEKNHARDSICIQAVSALSFVPYTCEWQRSHRRRQHCSIQLVGFGFRYAFGFLFARDAARRVTRILLHVSIFANGSTTICFAADKYFEFFDS